MQVLLESQLLTSLWNKYHQWLSDIELIQISAFSDYHILLLTLVSILERILGVEFVRNAPRGLDPENDHLHICTRRRPPSKLIDHRLLCTVQHEQARKDNDIIHIRLIFRLKYCCFNCFALVTF
jgi:hypothetical protein